jgi:hypothetical protein
VTAGITLVRLCCACMSAYSAHPSPRWGEGDKLPFSPGRIGERGSAKEFLKLFDASITYHEANADQGALKLHVHVAGMDLVKAPSPEAFVTRKIHEQGRVVYIWDAVDFSREGLRHCLPGLGKPQRPDMSQSGQDN